MAGVFDLELNEAPGDGLQDVSDEEPIEISDDQLQVSAAQIVKHTRIWLCQLWTPRESLMIYFCQEL